MNQQQKIIALGGASAAVILIGIFLLYRKRSKKEEEDEADDDTIKPELYFADLNAQEIASAAQTVVEVKVPSHLVGGIIGKGGANIKKLKADFGVRFDFDREEPKDNIGDAGKKDRNLVIRGEREKVLAAEIKVKDIIANTPKYVETEILVPQESCGRIIGKGGQTIRELCSVSGAKILVDRNEDRSLANQRKVLISGTTMQVDYAKLLIEEKVEQGKASAQKYKVLAPPTTTDFTKYLNSFPVAPLPNGQSHFQVFVSAFHAPDHFWIQVVSTDSVKLDLMTKEMTHYYGELGATEQRLQQGKVGDICVAPFEVDMEWYRACITSVNPNGMLDLYYMDFGDNRQVHINDVKAIREQDLMLPAHAVECYLPIKPCSFNWTQEAGEYFDTLAHCSQWIALMAKVIGYKDVEERQYPVLELIDTSEEKDVNIATAMISKGYAVKESHGIQPVTDGPVVVGDAMHVESDLLEETALSAGKPSVEEFIKNNSNKAVDTPTVVEDVLTNYDVVFSEKVPPAISEDCDEVVNVSNITTTANGDLGETNPEEQRSDIKINAGEEFCDIEVVHKTNGKHTKKVDDATTPNKETLNAGVTSESKENFLPESEENLLPEPEEHLLPEPEKNETSRKQTSLEMSDEFVDIDVKTVNGAITAIVSEHIPFVDDGEEVNADDKTIVNEDDESGDYFPSNSEREDRDMLSELQRSLDETSRKNVLNSMELARENLVSMSFDDSSLSNNDSFMSARSELTITDDTNSFTTAKERLTPVHDITVSLPDLSSSSPYGSQKDLTLRASPDTRRLSGKFEIQVIDEKTNRVMSREALNTSFEASLTKVTKSGTSVKGRETTV